MTKFRMSAEERRARRAAREAACWGGSNEAISAYLETYGSIAEQREADRIAARNPRTPPQERKERPVVPDAGKAQAAFNSALHMAKARNALPSWADINAIAKIYLKASEFGMQVDHIVPMHSKLVCGLHCEANLQLLIASENAAKRNRFWPDMP
jgi:hypothetical protein